MYPKCSHDDSGDDAAIPLIYIFRISLKAMELTGLEEVVIARHNMEDTIHHSGPSAHKRHHAMAAIPEIELTSTSPVEQPMSDTHVNPTTTSRTSIFSWQTIFAWSSCCAFAVTAVSLCVLASSTTLAQIPLWKYFMFAATLVPCHYLSRFIVFLISKLIEVSFTFTRTLLYFWIDLSIPSRRLLTAMSWCALFCVCLHTPHAFDSPVYDYGVRASCCLVIYCLVNFVRTVGGKLLAFRYHTDKHFDMVASALRKEYLLRQLCKQTSRHDKTQSFDMDVAQKMYELERHTGVSTTALPLGELDATIAERISAGTTNIEADARHTALYLFWHICVRADRDYLVETDLRHHVPDAEVHEAFSMLDLNGNGRVTLEEIVGAVQHIFEDRDNLSDMLRDANDIVVHLKDIIGVILHTMCLFVYCVIFKMDVSKVYVSFSSLVVVWSLVFAASIRNVYESVVFLFGVHPFDVGDVLVIADETVTVQKMGLNTCVFRKSDNSLMWYPNSKLSSFAIVNVSRSGCRTDVLTLDVDSHVTQAHLDTIRHACLNYMSKHPKDYKQKCQCQITTVKDADNLLLSVQWETMFGQADILRVARVRHGLYMVVATQLARLDIGVKKRSRQQNITKHQSETTGDADDGDSDGDSDGGDGSSLPGT